MQLAWDEHFLEIVVPAWQEYRHAETRLTAATRLNDAGQLGRARYDVLRHGAAAAIFLHHFAETIHRTKPGFLPAFKKSKAHEQVKEIRTHLSNVCTHLRTEKRCDDVSLLGDVADALKHAVLTINAAARHVSTSDAVLVVSTGFGKLPFGEGKYGGVEQVVILANSGPRALSTVLQNVIDAWRRLGQMNMPDLGEP
jgi:hypothetical protein